MSPRPLRPSTKPAEKVTDEAMSRENELGDQRSQPARATAISRPLLSPSWPSWQKPRRASASQPTRSLRYLVKQQLSMFPAVPFREDGLTKTTAVKATDTDLSSDDETPTTPTTPTDEKKQDVHPGPPYHVFTTRKKWQLVYIVSLAGLFSPLSSNIYFPALGDIADVGFCLSPAVLSTCLTSVAHRNRHRHDLADCDCLHGSPGRGPVLLGATQ
jgi:hypothetical protein